MYLTRQYASACAPITWCTPADRCSLERRSLIG